MGMKLIEQSKGERIFNAIAAGCGLHWAFAIFWLGAMIYECNTTRHVPTVVVLLSGFGFAVQSGAWVNGGCFLCKHRGGKW